MSKLLAASLLVMGLSAGAFAIQDQARNAPTRTAGALVTSVPDTDNRPYSRSMMGKVLKVNSDDNVIVIDEPKVGPIKFILDKKTRIRADKNTDLADKKDLSLADYKPGQTVKITYRLSDNKILEIRLKPALN